jgi:hypothetical protein
MIFLSIVTPEDEGNQGKHVVENITYQMLLNSCVDGIIIILIFSKHSRMQKPRDCSELLSHMQIP